MKFAPQPIQPVRVHRPLVNGVVQILTSVVEGGFPTDKSIERVFKANPKWGARDRRFVAESVYECVRWWRKLDHVTQKLGAGATIADRVKVFGELNHWEDNQPKPQEKKLNPFSPDYVPEGESKTLREITSVTDTPAKLWKALEKEDSALAHALPEWLDELGRKELGERWGKEMRVLNEVAPVDLRVNSLKATREQVITKLNDEHVNSRKLDEFPDAVNLPERKNIFSTQAFQSGMFEVQDRSSQRVARLLDPQPGERIVDACAGAGGKSLHIAALMKNKGRVIAMDVHERKLEELRKRARRAGAGIVETRLIDTTKVVKRQKDSADRVLLDVPCTGMGVLRRNPDTKLKLKPDDISRLLQTQAEILKNYSTMVRPGGVLVYSTCSILPSENEKQVEAFCSQNPDFVLEEQFTVWPSERNGDGFFAARLRRQKK